MKAIFSIILFPGLLLLSCDKDILDLKPLDAVSEADVWKDPELMNLYVNERYNELPHGFVWWVGGLRMTGITDESYHMHQPRVFKHTAGGLTADNMHFFSGFWLDAYQAIRNNNIFLENVDGTVGVASETARLTAEVRFLRAYFYAELISRYGGVPLLERSFSLAEDFGIGRSEYMAVVRFVVEELDLAVPDLMSRADATGEHFGRATKGAALALKARTLLYAASPLFNPQNDEDRWRSAAAACEELFALGDYTLSGDYAGLFLNAADPGVIFFRQFHRDQGWVKVNKPDGYYHYSGGHAIDLFRHPNGNGGWIGENPLQNFVDRYETLSGQLPVLGYTGDHDNLQQVINPEATDYDPNHPYDNRDPRLGYSVLHDGAIFGGRELEFWWTGLDSRDPNRDGWWNGSKLGYGIRKALDESWTQERSNLNGDQPWIYMRLAEFYLSYAEAQYHLGNEGLAREYVNKVRSRTGVDMPPVSAAGHELLMKIKHERTIELAFEANRWYDARRWLDAEHDFSQDFRGVEVIRDASTGEKSYRYFVQQGDRSFPSHHYLWPIPIEEILKSNLEQNPGY